MKDSLEKQIIAAKENLAILPKATKTNIDKYNAYLDSEYERLNPILIDCKNEIKKRAEALRNEFKFDEEIENPKLDFDLIKVCDSNVDSQEKMNLNIYYYELSHFYNNDLTQINTIILDILEKFKMCGINLKVDDFVYSENVQTYIGALLNNNQDISSLFEKLFWNSTDLITQIELNFRYLFFKNKKTIDKYYETKSNSENIDKYLSDYLTNKNNISIRKHNDKKYIHNLFMDKSLELDAFSDKNMSVLLSKVLLNMENKDNYQNLFKLYNHLDFYEEYCKYEYIVEDIKKLYADKATFKDMYNNKLKEIATNEKELFSINKKMKKTTGLFKINKKKLSELKLRRNNLFVILNNQYDELDNMKINDTIFNNINDDTSILDVLKIASFSYNYMVNLLKTNNENITREEISVRIDDLRRFVYGYDTALISNIAITEDKNIKFIIRDRYRLVNILVEDTNLDPGGIARYKSSIYNLLIYFDVINLGLVSNTNIALHTKFYDDLDFLFKVEKLNL